MHKRNIAVIGLGYVGLTTAVAFSQIGKVIAYDKNKLRINELKNGVDKNNEISSNFLNSENMNFTANPDELKKADFYIISVQTPTDKTNRPDFSILFDVTKMIANFLKKGDIVVFESSVYPGTTEEECIPLLEKGSGLVCNKDFSVGYSPERINPADKEHDFYHVIKIVSASNKTALNIISGMFKQVVKPGVYPVSKISIAEAAKIIENTQRDVNIALMNDIAIILHKLNIDTNEVINAMKTKWNCINFKPGLVGGHCIGINSYYLMYKAAEAGYYSELIASGRRVNEFISKFIVEEAIKLLTEIGTPIKHARVGILGLTYKENCKDVRDTRVIDIINELRSYQMEVIVHDPIADKESAKKEYGLELITWEELVDLDAIILTIRHKQYVDLDKNKLKRMVNNRGLIMDINAILDPKDFLNTGIILWRL